MNIQLTSISARQAAADVLAVPAFEGEVPRGLDPWVETLVSSGEFTGKPQELSLVPRPAGYAAQRLALVGAGKRDKSTAAEFRKTVSAAVRALKAKSLLNIAIVADAGHVTAAAEGAILGDWEPDAHKSKKDSKRLSSFTVVVPDGDPALETALARGRHIGEAQNFARDLANDPPNVMTPSVLAERARTMAEAEGLDCEILDERAMRHLGFGALLGVAQGSAEPPALIVLRYKPAAPSPIHLALVGKAVTFDTGGISIKPSENMDQMKFDMCGGAAAIGAMMAIARLKPGIAVTAYVPAVENMPGSRAQRPGDIVKSLAGKTVEVLNTDAEGRLILIDAMTYAIREGATHLIDAATLTGAIGVALGRVNAGLFSNDAALQDRVLASAKAQGEKMWPMPMDDEYKEMLKSVYADMPNISGGRGAGAITAAKFLEEWTEGKPWVHLDIASLAWLDEAKPWMAKGPTGFGVRTFVDVALHWG
ncbi:MAG: leucyl aminopeptidase [Bryobacteraceae bacterium]|nr:leucyl aminopeptidase [Bryobacteraceae bacterium]